MRLDTVEDLVATGAEIREKISNRLDNVVSDVQHVEDLLEDRVRDMRQHWSGENSQTCVLHIRNTLGGMERGGTQNFDVFAFSVVIVAASIMLPNVAY